MADISNHPLKQGRKMEKMTGNVQVVKKWCGYVGMFLMAVVMVCMMDAFSVVSFASSGKTNSNAKIRKEANPNSTQLGLAEKGTTVEISGEAKGTDGKTWYKVTVKEISGYIRSDLIDVTSSEGNTDGNAGKTSTTIDGLEQVVALEATVSGGNTVRIRTSASTANSNNILTTVANGTKVTVVARTTGSDKKLWYQIKLTVDGKEVMGYIRHDYLTLSGEVKPLTEENIAPQEQETPPDDNKQQSDDQPKNTETPTETKRYDTKFMNDKWYMLDYEANKQYDIDLVFSSAKEFEEKYVNEQAKTKKLKTWLTVFILLAIAGCGTAIYLIYVIRTEKEKEYIDSFGDDRRKRTSDRPVERSREGGRSGAQTGRDNKPAIKDGLESRKDGGARPVQNGQRQTNGQRQGTVQNGQRQANAQGAQQRTNDGQRAQNGAQNNRAAGGQGQNGARTANQQSAQNGGQRPAVQDQGRRVQGGQQTQQSRANAAAQSSQAQQSASRAKNFVQDDENEFEFSDWDSDDE